jgi:hypothetical protein
MKTIKFILAVFLATLAGIGLYWFLGLLLMQILY